MRDIDHIFSNVNLEPREIKDENLLTTTSLKSSRRHLPVALALLTTAVLAASFGPYPMASKYPGVTFAADQEVSFGYAQSLPRLFLFQKVQAIGPGQKVRIIYSDGSVYDFETTIRCSYAASPSCIFKNPEKVDSPASPAKASSKSVQDLRDDTCPWDSRWQGVKTGYWRDEWREVAPNQIEHSAGWVDTGTVQVYIKGSGCK
jgi:hypothetical protein